MPVERFFSESSFTLNQELFLTESEFHHLIHVIRSKEGEEVELVNGQGFLAHARIDKIEKKGARLRITNLQHGAAPSPELILAQAIPRLNRLDFILEKGTELGMTQILLYPTELSERKEFTPHQLERMRGVTIAAMKQCGSLYLPKIVIKPPLLQWKELDCFSLYGDVESQAQYFTVKNLPSDITKDILFFIGPESGFTDNEVTHLKKLGAHGVKLHSNILRTDTAALTALTILHLYTQLRIKTI